MDTPYSRGGYSLLERRILLTREADTPYPEGGYYLLGSLSLFPSLSASPSPSLSLSLPLSLPLLCLSLLPLLGQYLAWPGTRCGRRPWAAVARFLFPFPLHLSPRPQRVRAALGGGRKKRRFGTAECRVTIWPYFWLICPPCPLDHPNSTPKFRGWRKAGASTFFLFQEGLVTRHPSDLVLVVQRSRLLPSSLLWV